MQAAIAFTFGRCDLSRCHGTGAIGCVTVAWDNEAADMAIPLCNSPRNTKPDKTTENWATQTVVTGAANVLKEFWPDIRRNILRRK
jgi:hypothetical protein